jgi:hypothetical protein
MLRPVLLLGLALAASAACGPSGPGSCDKQRDITGTWTFTATPAAVDGGVAEAIPQPFSIEAELIQFEPAGVLTLGRYLYGTLRASDPAFFGTLEIPRLMMNDGSKTGSMLGCRLRINVPIQVPVRDDDTNEGPLRLSLAGTVTAPGVIEGDPRASTVILVGDPIQQPRSFSWVGSPR